jgi:type IV conjugative transfer system protein TraL
METTIPIPIFLNATPRISFFERNEVVLFMHVWMFFFLFDFLVLGLLAGVLAVKGRRALQKSEFGDLTKIGIYWLLPFEITRFFFKAVPPCHQREFLG